MVKHRKRHANNQFIEAAHRAVRKVGWDPRYDLEIVRGDGSSNGNAVRYGYRAGKIRLMESPNLLEHLESLRDILDQVDLGKPPDCLEDIVGSRVYMQFGGWDVCPYSSIDYGELLEATADGLRSAGMQEPQVQQFVVPVTSFFIGSVISSTYAIDGPDPTRFRRGWQLDLIVSSHANEIKLPRYTSLYASIQLRLWADNPSLTRSVRNCFEQPFDALDFETDRGVAILLDSLDFNVGEDGLVWHDDALRESLFEELKFNYRSWPIKAFQFAEMMAPLVSNDLPEQRPPQRSSPNDPRQRPSAQAHQRRAAVQVPDGALMQMLLRQGQPAVGQLPCTPIDSFAERLTRDSWFRQNVLQSRIGTGKGPLKILPGFDALDVLYRNRATGVEIESETIKKRGMSFPISHMARERLEQGVPGLNNIDWGATRISQDDQLVLFRKRLPITDDIPARMELGGFPDLLFCCDSSGSMQWDPFTGTGAYDSLLRAVYSVFQFLEKQNKAQHMRFAVVNFSGTTLHTAWEDYNNIRVVKKMLFKHQSGGTKLNAATLENIARQSKDRFLCLMVSDGQISNPQDVVNAIQSMVSHGHGFVLIQIGSANSMSQAVEALGLPVHLISDHRQLEGLCLEYSKQTWKGGD